MRILITGGFGFVGGRVAQALTSVGHEVTLASRTQRLVPDWLSTAATAQWSWERPPELQALCSGFDVLVHAAGMNASECAQDPPAALGVNGLATARLVHAAALAGVRHFIYLSTAHVYDSPLAGSISEASCPRNMHPYATSHLAGEHVVLHAARQGLLNGTVLRLSNAFGAPVEKNVNCWTLLANDLCLQAVKNKVLVLRTQGLQQRDFVPMHAVCDSVAFVLDAGRDRAAEEIFNVGSGRSISVLKMAQLVQRRCLAVLGFSPTLIVPEDAPNESGEPLDYRIDKLRDMGWQLSDNYQGELDQLLTFCREQML